MKQYADDTERVVVRYRKYSAWTVIKIILFAWIITFMMTGGSFGLVSFDVFFAKACGFVDSVVDWCANCCQALR